MKKMLLIVGVVLMSACASTTEPTVSKAPSAKSVKDDFTCRAGYQVAYDQDGNPYCVQDG